ncbi:MAG: nucleotidyltransferase family protein [Actinomycetota bacterium]|nr:nucleotidyltransferase family protein [Actinomycetota bacterium]
MATKTGQHLRTLVEHRREEIKAAVARHRGLQIALFGSVARGDASEESDVDFLVDFQPDSSLFDLLHLQDELQAILGCPVDVVSTRAAARRRGRRQRGREELAADTAGGARSSRGPSARGIRPRDRRGLGIARRDRAALRRRLATARASGTDRRRRATRAGAGRRAVPLPGRPGQHGARLRGRRCRRAAGRVGGA